MPIDPSIALQVRPPQFMTPEQAVSLQALSRQNQLGQLQLEDAMSARGERAALRGALQAPGAIDPKTGTVSLEGLQEVYRRSPEAGVRMAKERLASLKSVAEAGKIDAETMKARVEAATKKADLGAQVYQAASIAYDQARAAGIPEAQAVAAGRTALLSKMDTLERGGLLADAGLTPEAIMQVRSDAPDPMKWRSQAQTYTQFLTDLRAAQGQKVTTRGQDLSAETARRGQDIAASTARRGQDLADKRAGQTADEGKIPPGYRRTPDGNLEAIPGGPAGAKDVKKDEEVNRTLQTYIEARNGLLTGLTGTITGPALGRIPAVTAKQQIGEGAVAAMAPVLKQLFRVAGEGVFTDRDQQLLLDMVPKRSDEPKARAVKMENIDRIVSAKLGREVPEYVPPKAPGELASGLTPAEDAELKRLREKYGRPR